MIRNALQSRKCMSTCK